ncbi:MAG: hypothetical protein ABR538_15260, partial [Candidatus Binatia bacterium]
PASPATPAPAMGGDPRWPSESDLDPRPSDRWASEPPPPLYPYNPAPHREPGRLRAEEMPTPSGGTEVRLFRNPEAPTPPPPPPAAPPATLEPDPFDAPDPVERPQPPSATAPPATVPPAAPPRRLWDNNPANPPPPPTEEEVFPN